MVADRALARPPAAPLTPSSVRAVPSGPPFAGVPVWLTWLARRLPGLTRPLTAAHAALFRRTGGRLLGRWFGTPILVLETLGRRSGRPRAVPVVYLPDGPNLVVVPANGGARRPPAWWLNLRAAGEGVAVLGRDRVRIRPIEATGAERERLWRRFAAVSPVDHYRGCAPRRIPVVVLAPVLPPAGGPPRAPQPQPCHSAPHGGVALLGDGGRRARAPPAAVRPGVRVADDRRRRSAEGDRQAGKPARRTR